ncbi:MAG TPA: hypothetical protein VM901_04935 [Bdellovibrionota bacterium]|jgi:hypothetical protein|nr:hypothetical protein [Bdellovibrionota bacterium]
MAYRATLLAVGLWLSISARAHDVASTSAATACRHLLQQVERMRSFYDEGIFDRRYDPLSMYEAFVGIDYGVYLGEALEVRPVEELRRRNPAAFDFLRRAGFDWRSPLSSEISRASLLQTYHSRIDALLRSRSVREEEVIWPGMMRAQVSGSGFRDREVVALGRYEGSVENHGLHRRLVESATFANLTLLEQIEALERGLFGVSEGVVFVHELGHLVGFLTDANYMSALRREARHFLQSDFAQVFRASYEAGEDFAQRAEVNRFKLKYIIAMERLVTFAPSSRASLGSFLLPSDQAWAGSGGAPALPSVEKVQRDLVSLHERSPERVHAMVRSLVEHYDAHAVRLGGATADLYSPQRLGAPMLAENDATPVLENLAFLVEALRAAPFPIRDEDFLLHLRDTHRLESEETRRDRYFNVFALAYVLTLASSKYHESTEWVEWAFSVPGSPRQDSLEMSRDLERSRVYSQLR